MPGGRGWVFECNALFIRHSQFRIRNLLDSVFLPALGNLLLDFLRHADSFWPGTRKSFAGPLARGVHAHLAAEIWQARSVVERIDGTEGELDVALWIDIVEYSPGDVI
jgi:hypothetical protein